MTENLIILDDLRNNMSTANFLHEELEFELQSTIQADIICAPNPVKAWMKKHGITNFSSLESFLRELTKPIILIDWGMPVPSQLKKENDVIQADEKSLDGLYLFYLIRKTIGITHCFIWSQFEFGDASNKGLGSYTRVHNDFESLVRSSWLPKATTTGKKLANKVQ